MSTFTNLGFEKPDLTDAADITVYNQNWDRLDERLSHNNIRSYTELSQFGLSDNEMSPTDFVSNIDKIITTLDDNAAEVRLIVQNDINPNLHASLIGKLNQDTPIAFTTESHAGWLFIRFSGEAYRPTVVETNLETANYYNRVWTCIVNKGAESTTVSKFTTGVEEKVTLWQNNTGSTSFSVTLEEDPLYLYDHFLIVTNYGTSIVRMVDDGLTSGSALMNYTAGRWEVYAPQVEISGWTMKVSTLGVGLWLPNSTIENVVGNMKVHQLIGVKSAI